MTARTGATPPERGTLVRVAAVQPKLLVGAVESNLVHLEELVRDAVREHDPDVVVLPEAASSPTVHSPAVHHVARPIDGAPMQLFRQLARELGVVVAGGFLARRGADVYGTYAVVEPDGRVHLHDKAFPVMWENSFHRGGDDDGRTSLSTLAGEDGREIPIAMACGWEWARTATAARLRGRVQLLVGGMCWPSAPDNWTGRAGRWAHEEHRRQLEHARALPAQMARLIGAPAVLASQVGEVEFDTPLAPGLPWHTQMLGETQIVDRDGTVLARLDSGDGEGHTSAQIVLDTPVPSRPLPAREWIPHLGVSTRVAWSGVTAHGAVKYRGMRLLGRHPWQRWPGGDVPDETGPARLGEALPATTGTPSDIGATDMPATDSPVRVLIVLSAADHWTLEDGTRHPTGFWAEEFIEPHKLFREAGWDITLATPGGKAPTVDQTSLGVMGGLPHKTAAYRRYLRDHADGLATPEVLSEVDPDEFDLVFYPGGHGPMEDLAHDPDSGALLTRRLRSGRPLALLCHSPAAALAATNEDGSWPFEGRRMTAFTNREELLNGLSRKAPWLLEDRLVDKGADFVRSPVPLAPFVAVDRNLYTGQNPTSSKMLARRLVADLAHSPSLRVSVSRTIAAPPEAVYDVLSDIDNMGRLSPETYASTWIERDKKFVGLNRIGPLYQWPTLASITEATPPTTFAFHVAWPSNTSWRFDLTPGEKGTVVTETMTKADLQMAPVRAIQRLVGVRDRQEHLRAGMATTLERLDDLVTGT